jgi:hypothetical protein
VDAQAARISERGGREVTKRCYLLSRLALGHSSRALLPATAMSETPTRRITRLRAATRDQSSKTDDDYEGIVSDEDEDDGGPRKRARTRSTAPSRKVAAASKARHVPKKRSGKLAMLPDMPLDVLYDVIVTCDLRGYVRRALKLVARCFAISPLTICYVLRARRSPCALCY